MNKIKTTIINTMITTGTALVILSAFLIIFDERSLFIHTIFQIFGANIVINCGLLLTHKFESRYVILEYLLDVSYIIAVLIVFGIVFNWYSAIPVWVLVIMAVVIYVFMIVLTMYKIQKDTQKINELLQKRKEKTVVSAS